MASSDFHVGDLQGQIEEINEHIGRFVFKNTDNTYDSCYIEKENDIYHMIYARYTAVNNGTTVIQFGQNGIPSVSEVIKIITMAGQQDGAYVPNAGFSITNGNGILYAPAGEGHTVAGSWEIYFK